MNELPLWYGCLNVLAPVPGKQISANRGLNPFNPGIKFILRLVSVPESMSIRRYPRDKLSVKFNTPSEVD